MLPAGSGKEVKVAVFTELSLQEEVSKAGADVIGTDQVLKDIEAGTAVFDRIIATPEQMPELKRYARILGPKGLMPNVKSGTLVKHDELIETVK